jgi:hypothetical protein
MYLNQSRTLLGGHRKELLPNRLRRAVHWNLPLRLLGLVMLLCACHAVVLAQSTPTELKWGELDQLIGGHQIQLVLPDGTVIKGEAVAIREDSLVMDVKKTSNKDSQPKGNAAVPRDSVVLLRLERRRGSWGRSLGTTVGVIAGVVLGGYAAGTLTSSAGPGIATFIGVASLGTVAGNMAGAEMDRKVTFIKVVP